MIIWLNGGFAAGKTTLAQELHRRLPDAVVYDPEDVGIMLWKWVPLIYDLKTWAPICGVHNYSNGNNPSAGYLQVH